MTLSSIRTRLTRTSSDLRTLSAILLPLSPILKAEDMLIHSSSGEIPILLETATCVFESPPSLWEPPGLWNPGGGETEEADIILAEARGLINSNESIPERRIGVSSNETRFAAELLYGRHDESPSDSFARTISFELENACYYDFLGGDSRCRKAQDHLAPQTPNDFEKRRGSRPNEAALSYPGLPQEDPDANQLPMIATSHTYSTLPTPTLAPPPPPPSSTVMVLPFSPPANRQHHRRPLERAGAVRFPGHPRSPRLQTNENEARPVCDASHSPTRRANPRRQLAGAPRMIDMVHHLMKRVGLAEELSWPDPLIIELWFDQEGFRAAKSCMQLIGYSPRTRSLHPYEPAEVGSDMTAGIAEFMPAKRETFTYHYATLDSPPTLRMVSIAGDESRDYVSRQAALNVKFNGVYTVIGTETPTAPILTSDRHGSRLHNQRLRWKFDYLVGDRKVDGTGKTIPGEKTLTPLTFSCSPYLFHPLQGKKTRLMHIVKKNLAPKIGSQKVEPPAYSPGRNTLPRISRHLFTGRDVTVHARSRSDALGKDGHYLLAHSLPLDTKVGGISMGGIHLRRRRASSAGENSVACLRNESSECRCGTIPSNYA